MRPKRALSIPFEARFTTRKAPERFVSMTEVKSSSDIRMRSMSRVIPAFATTTSTGPSFSSTRANAASIDAASVTSAITVSDPSGPVPDRAVTATRWPRATNSRAMANPIPRFPPVTRTVLGSVIGTPFLGLPTGRLPANSHKLRRRITA